MAGTTPEELVQNTRRCWNLHRRYCIQNFDAGSTPAVSQSLKTKEGHVDVRMSRGGRRRRSLDLPADDLQTDRHSLGTHLNVVKNAVAAGCVAFRRRGYLPPTVRQVHLRPRLHGRHSHGSSVRRARSLLDHPNRLDHACLACQMQDPGTGGSTMGSCKLRRVEAHREKASISTLVVISSFIMGSV